MISNQLSKRFINVESFEIDTDVFECLKLNMQNKTSNVTIHNFGIGDVDRSGDLPKTAKTWTMEQGPPTVGESLTQTSQIPVSDYGLPGNDDWQTILYL